MLDNQTMSKLRRIAPELAGTIADYEEEYLTGMNWEERLTQYVDTAYATFVSDKIKRLISAAKLPRPKATWRNLELIEERGLDKNLIAELSTCNWIAQAKNVVFTGPTGAGKTHLACALATLACQREYRVKFHRQAQMERKWAEFKETPKSLDRYQATLTRPDVLIIDDWLLAEIDPGFRGFILEVLTERDEVKPTIFTSQYQGKDWHQRLGGTRQAEAVMDRIIQGAHMFNAGTLNMREQTRA